MKRKTVGKLIVILLCPLFFIAGHAQKIDSAIPIKPLRYSKKQFYIPVALTMSGIGLSGNGTESLKNQIVEERNDLIPTFKTKLDNYLQFSPLALTYGFEAIGMKPKTDILNRSVIVLKSELVMLAAVTVLKNATHVLRPDSSGYASFPSGHTAQAFAAATIFAEEYGYRYKWVPYLSYSLASTVGILRMAKNKHYLSDVLVGAGLGILSTKVSYWSHRYNWGKPRARPRQS